MFQSQQKKRTKIKCTRRLKFVENCQCNVLNNRLSISSLNIEIKRLSVRTDTNILFQKTSRSKVCSEFFTELTVRLHTEKFSLDKKISFVLNPLVGHGSSQDKEKLPVQGKFSCV